MNRKGNGIALAKGNDLDPALHARPLLRQHEFAAGKILPRLRQQDRHLDRKGKIAVEILMQAIEIAGDILQQQRRRPRLAGVMTLAEEVRVLSRVSFFNSHAAVPLIGDLG
ncbi:hypothetical protein D3C71_1956510 [compost metagenome]